MSRALYSAAVELAERDYARAFLEDAILKKKVKGTGIALSQAAKPVAEACVKVASKEVEPRKAFYACLSELFGAVEAAAREVAGGYASLPAEQAERAVEEAAKKGGFALVVDGVEKSLGELAAGILKACARSTRTKELGTASAAFACTAEIARLLKVRAEELGGFA